MRFDVYNGNEKATELELSPWWDKASDKVLHQVVVARLANERAGTASTKTRAEVRASRAKPFKQKGTGRARRGSMVSPLMRGGGVSFGPKPRDFSQSVNKKMRANAYLYAISEVNRQERLRVLQDFSLTDAKTKSFLQAVEPFWTQKGRLTVVTADYDKNILLASRNVPQVAVCAVESLDILSVVYADTLLITVEALQRLDAKYAKLLTKRVRGENHENS